MIFYSRSRLVLNYSIFSSKITLPSIISLPINNSSPRLPNQELRYLLRTIAIANSSPLAILILTISRYAEILFNYRQINAVALTNLVTTTYTRLIVKQEDGYLIILTNRQLTKLQLPFIVQVPLEVFYLPKPLLINHAD